MHRVLPLLCLALVTSAAHAQSYSIVDLGTLGGPSSMAHGINAKGWVVGESMTSDLHDHAFLYHDGKMVDLGTPGDISAANAVNESGQIGGYYYVNGFQAFMASEDKSSDIGALSDGYCITHSINALGHAVGGSLTKDRRKHAFLWDGNTMTDLGTLGGIYSMALGVNASDEVVGYAYLSTGNYHAFSGGPRGITDLGTLGGGYSAADAVNNAGQIVGYSYLAANVKQHACLWEGGKLHDLGDLGGDNSEALALDAAGTHIVGRSSIASTTGYVSYRAFLWSDGAMHDLNSLVPANSGWVLEEATGVNDAGQIVGSGTYQNQHRAFLLQPSTPGTTQQALPKSLALSGATPNPTRDSAHFSYGLPRSGQVSIRVLDVSGRLVRDLVHETQAAGTHDLVWDLTDDGGRRIGSGVYYAHLQLDQETRTTTVQVLR